MNIATQQQTQSSQVMYDLLIPSLSLSSSKSNSFSLALKTNNTCKIAETKRQSVDPFRV